MSTFAAAGATRGPRYLSTVPDGQVGNLYVPVPNDWGLAMVMPGLDQVIAICSLSVGYEAQMRFWKDGAPGQPVPIFTGSQAFSEQLRYGYDKVEFRNAVSGQVAEVIVIVQGA